MNQYNSTEMLRRSIHTRIMVTASCQWESYMLNGVNLDGLNPKGNQYFTLKRPWCKQS